MTDVERDVSDDITQPDDKLSSEAIKKSTDEKLPEAIDKSSTDEEIPESNGKTEENKQCGDNSKLEADIIRQVEYYFGDANLMRDKFLLAEIAKDEQGWVSFSVLLKFKRLANLSTNVDEIVNALMKSDEGLIEISDDKTKIRRHPERPLPEFNEEKRKEVCSRTAYAKGFPLDAELSDLIEYFNSYEKVVNVVMRRYFDKGSKTYKFKGSVFVTFAKKEQCEDFVNKEKILYKERELLRKWQQAYITEKREETASGKKNSKKHKIEPELPQIQLPKGTLIYFDAINVEQLVREKIKAEFSNLGAEVCYIDFNRGDKKGYIRLAKEDSAKEILDKIENNKLNIKGTEAELTLKLIEGEEEEKILEDVVKSMLSHRNNSKNARGGGGFKKNSFRKRKGGNRNRDDRDDYEPHAKSAKADE